MSIQTITGIYFSPTGGTKKLVTAAAERLGEALGAPVRLLSLNTPAMRAAIDETARRRSIQDAYNKAHGIVPKTIVKSVRELLEISSSPDVERKGRGNVKMTRKEREREIEKLEKKMREAAKMMEYEYAAVLRDEIIRLRGEE